MSQDQKQETQFHVPIPDNRTVGTIKQASIQMPVEQALYFLEIARAFVDEPKLKGLLDEIRNQLNSDEQMRKKTLMETD